MSAKASIIFSTKTISVFAYKVIKHLTSWSLNELVKLTMLWTTGPWNGFLQQLFYENLSRIWSNTGLEKKHEVGLENAIIYRKSNIDTWRGILSSVRKANSVQPVHLHSLTGVFFVHKIWEIVILKGECSNQSAKLNWLIWVLAAHTWL